MAPLPIQGSSVMALQHPCRRCLHGSNDPWVPAKTCLKLPVPEHPLTGISVVVTRGGGHVGFHDTRLNWHIRATLAWCDAVAAAG